MTIDETIGANVHELLWRKKLQQRSLMTAIGVSRSGLAKKLRGQITWTAPDIEAAAQVLKVDPGYLFASRAIPSVPESSDSATGRYHVANVIRMPFIPLPDETQDDMELTA